CRGVATAHRCREMHRRKSQLLRDLTHLPPRLGQVAMNVCGERLERGYVDDTYLVGQPAVVHCLARQRIDGVQERGERFPRPGRRGDERVMAGTDRLPAIGLCGRRWGERRSCRSGPTGGARRSARVEGKAALPPLLDQRVEGGERGCGRRHPLVYTPVARLFLAGASLPVTPLSAPEHHRTDRRMKPRPALFSALIGLAFGLLAGPVAGQRPNTVGIRPGEQCPAGMTEIRPLQCMAPQLEAPSILDYRPRSTLIVPEHPIPRPKYPAIDFHGHPRLDGPESLAELEAAMDRIGLGVMIVASNVRGERLREMLALIQASPTMRDRVRVFTGIEFGNLEPGWVERAVAQIEADVAAGAVGIGEISKSLGLSIRKPDGSRLAIDDPVLDPIWEAAARLGMPVFIHTADPAEFFRELDYSNERWLELALFPTRRYPQDEYPSFEQLLAERDNLFRRHPRTTFVTAHLGWQAN